MPSRVLRSERAVADLLACYEYIHHDNPAAAERFLDMAEATFRRLADLPESGRLWDSPDPRLAGVRVVPLPGPFDHYLVFYRPDFRGGDGDGGASDSGDDGAVSILAVLHAARDLPASFG